MLQKLLGVVGVSGLLITAPLSAASAADMLLKAPPPAPVASWTGCYVGGNVGYVSEHNSWYDVPAATDAGGDRGNSALGGAQLGCDYQFASRWVVGVQGMFDWTGINNGHVYPGTGSEVLNTKTDWVDTLTARIGYAVVPQALLYLKGGGAWASTDYSDSNAAVVPAYAGQASVTRSGWTIGGGLEYAFLPNWSVFAEYDYIDLGSQNVSLTYDCGGACGFANPYSYRVSHDLSEVLVGLNYRFSLAGVH
jgi:outer membrane immunogenic protein